MKEIEMLLLQTPKITADGEPVTLPFKKAEGLLYYLAVKKIVSREQAAALFWASAKEQTAKKNLRHALYIIRKTFQEDVIISPQKQLLSLNPEITYRIDYDEFLKNDRPELYHGEFLQGFHVKNAEEFEEWLALERISLRDVYLRKLYERMIALEGTKVAEAEACFKSYLREDPLDERVYQQMMQIYQKNHLYHKGIKIYESLSRQLNTELRISPGKETAALYRSLLTAWTQEAAREEGNVSVTVMGREKEVRELTGIYHAFLAGKPAAVFLSGDNGVGKSHLLNHFLDSLEEDNCLILRNICFSQDQNFAFHPWNTVMLQLDRYLAGHPLDIPRRYLDTVNSLFPLFGDRMTAHVPEDAELTYNYRTARNGLLKLFTLVGAEIPLILFFDNIQFMDAFSLELLSAMIRDQNPNILIFGTHLDIVKPQMQKYICSLAKERLIREMEILPFSKETVRAFFIERFGEQKADEKLLEQIYKETEGNAFFLENVLAGLRGPSPANAAGIQMQNILSDRILALSEDARELLGVLSLFPDYTTPELLEAVTGMETARMLALLEELKQQALIVETVKDKEIHFQFRHNKMQEFVHGQLSYARRQFLHQKVASCLLTLSIPRNSYWYERVIYHYTQCGDEPNALKYRILELEEFSAFNFELYPILTPLMDASAQASARMAATFEELRGQLYQLCHQAPDAIDYSESEARLLYLAGKYYISQGDYEKGLAAIRQVISRNEYVGKHPDFLILCYRQLTFYGIQVWDTVLMEQGIEKCMELERARELTIDLTIENRLYGLLLAMRGEYRQSGQYLERAVEGFKQSPLKAQSFALNIAACYNYLGELYRKQQQFPRAITYYKKAIATCTRRNCPASPTFYTNLARAYLAFGQYSEGRETLEAACRLYDDSSILMGRSIAKGFLSCMEAAEGRTEEAAVLLRDAKETAPRLSSPLELGLLALVKVIWLVFFPEQCRFSPGETKEELCKIGKEYLEKLPGCEREIQVLDSFLAGKADSLFKDVSKSASVEKNDENFL